MSAIIIAHRILFRRFSYEIHTNQALCFSVQANISSGRPISFVNRARKIACPRDLFTSEKFGADAGTGVKATRQHCFRLLIFTSAWKTASSDGIRAMRLSASTFPRVCASHSMESQFGALFVPCASSETSATSFIVSFLTSRTF